MNLSHIIQMIFTIGIPLIFAITLHEAAHGYVAKMRGDMTAYNQGRVTLNPVSHIDLMGTIVVPVGMILLSMASGMGLIFGWAKPVPVNYNALKKPRFDMALVAVAGPMANLVMAIGWYLLMKYVPIHSYGFEVMAYYGFRINILIMVLNLLPIPPLDGSKIITSFLSYKSAIKYNGIEKYGMLILLALIFINIKGASLLFVILTPFINMITNLIQYIF